MALGTVPKRHCGRLHNAARKEHSVLEFKLCLWLPFPISLQCFAEQFAILKTRQSLRRIGPKTRGRRANDSAQAGEQGRFTAMSFRSKEDVVGRGCRPAATFIRVEPPTPPQRH
jgi:hypothetical protein